MYSTAELSFIQGTLNIQILKIQIILLHVYQALTFTFASSQIVSEYANFCRELYFFQKVFVDRGEHNQKHKQSYSL